MSNRGITIEAESLGHGPIMYESKVIQLDFANAPRTLMMVGLEDMTCPPKFSSVRIVASTFDQTCGFVAESLLFCSAGEMTALS